MTHTHTLTHWKRFHFIFQSGTNSSVDDEYFVDETDAPDRAELCLDSSVNAFKLPLATKSHFSESYFPPLMNAETPAATTADCSSSHGLAGRRSLVLVIGSEAHGVSPEAYHLAHLTGGSRISVPLAPGTESLNVVSAFSAIVGEMQRQYLTSQSHCSS